MDILGINNALNRIDETTNDESLSNKEKNFKYFSEYAKVSAKSAVLTAAAFAILVPVGALVYAAIANPDDE